MIQIETEDQFGTQRHTTWMLSQEFPYIGHNQKIFSLEADREELAMIKANFQNIPLTNLDAVQWVGEIATFIYKNLYKMFR